MSTPTLPSTPSDPHESADAGVTESGTPNTTEPDTGAPDTGSPDTGERTAPRDRSEPFERRARTRRTAATQRAAWMAARARNAARRWILIATVGGGAVVATLLALVLLPREVDRAIRAQLESIPAARDTAPLIAAIESAGTRRAAAESRASELRAFLAARASAAAEVAAATAPSADITLRDSMYTDLQQRLTRARTAPLVESYRALAGARLLRDDDRVRGIVDSIEQVDKEREAYAALGGVDARYASLTSRLAALGQRIIRIAEQQLAVAPPPAPRPAPPVALAPPPAAAVPPATDPVQGAAAAAAAAAAAGTTPPGANGMPADTDTSAAAVAQRAALTTYRAEAAEAASSTTARATADTIAMLERTLVSVRAQNAALEARRAQVRARGGITVPPLAMLIASLVVGLALGYASAVLRELRRPTVGDENEVERLAQARVITHTGSPDVLRDTRTRRRSDRMLPPVLDPTAEAWQQLHLTLTGLGEVARAVRIVSDQPMLGNALAINLAAAAARESRATLIVEPPVRTSMLAMLLRQAKPRGLNDVQQGRAGLREVITEVPMGRDVAVDVLFSGNASSNAPSVANRSEINEDIRRASLRYDLTLIVGDPATDIGITNYDLIICARLGTTSLDWLARTMQQAKGGNHRLRAVLLWAAEMPTL